MKKIYLHLMALICLLLCGGVNAWAEDQTWIGDDNVHTLSTTEWNSIDNIGSNNVTTKVSIKGDWLDYNKNNRGIRVYYKTQVGGIRTALLKTTQTGVYSFTIEGGWVSQDSHHEVTFDEPTTGFSMTKIVNAATSTPGAGVSFTFEMQADKEYQISSTQNIYIKKVVRYGEDSYIILDETESKATNNSIITNATKNMVKLVRTLKAGQWNTFCLPVSVSAEELKCDAAYEMTGFANDEITFFAVTQLQPNTPYLIQPTQDVVNPVIIGAVSSPTAATKTVSGLSFIGVYGAEDIYTDNHSKFYLNNSGYLVYPTSSSNSTIKGLRAYFQLASGGVKDLNIVFDDSEVTGIKTIEHDIFGENGRVYSIDGRYMGDSTDNLSRGIYIQNGRKFVVK